MHRVLTWYQAWCSAWGPRDKENTCVTPQNSLLSGKERCITKQLSLHNRGMKISPGIEAQVVMKPARGYHGKIYTGDGM